jgi:ribonucleoside-diphosphate reductase alpha chain
MDDMIDLEIEKVEKIIAKIMGGDGDKELRRSEAEIWLKIKETYEKGRRIGLGVTGMADLIAQMNLKYGSEESIKFIDMIFRVFKNSSYYESAMLAKERGAFNVFDFEKENNHPSYSMLRSNVVECLETYGRRNIAINTCAPTGTISTLTQTSSGIEPVFMLSYLRNKKVSEEEISNGAVVSNIDDDGIKWTQYEVVHRGLEEWRALTGYEKPDEESPYFGCTAQEIDWKDRVKMQATIQKYIDHSISSTVNLHKDTTVEEISDIYLEAWRQGCKGITIYRDTSRTGVLVATNDKKDSPFCLTCAPKRDKELECDIHYSNVMGKSWVFFVGIKEGRPYDIFGGKQSNIDIPKKFKTGRIKKNGKVDGVRTYDLILGDEEIIIKDIAREFSPDIGANTRLISTMLRHGIPIKFICEQLNKIGEDADLFCFEKSVARVLKKYIKDGEKAGGKCPECDGDLIYADGCVRCLHCGWSKCG